MCVCVCVCVCVKIKGKMKIRKVHKKCLMLLWQSMSKTKYLNYGFLFLINIQNQKS